MKALWLTKNSLIWYAVCIGSLALVITALVCVIRSVHARRGWKRILPAVFGLCISFALFVIHMDCARYAYLTEPDPRYQPFQFALFELPWGLYAGLEILCAVLLFLMLREDARYRRTHLTPDAIRDTLDLLPEGLAISTTDGTVLLSNLRMDELCRLLTGTLLSDMRKFREQIQSLGEQQNGEFLVKTPRETVWRFTRRDLETGEGTFDLLSASDVTERYRILDELREKNARLQEVQRRMKSVSDLSAEMFTTREEANARAALHNELGQVLLMGRHYLDHPDSTDAKQIYLTTQQMNRFLLGDAPEPETEKKDVLQQAQILAKSIGVTVAIAGEAPEEESLREFLAQAIRECAANTVKHAEGDRLSVTVTAHAFTLTNNGKPPKEPIRESGGLLTLRENVAEAGGEMRIQSDPAFVLTISIP